MIGDSGFGGKSQSNDRRLKIRAAQAAPAHLFRSADGSKTFKGQVQGYDVATKIVTVRRENGKLMRFDLKKLHPDDQAFVTSDATDGEP